VTFDDGRRATPFVGDFAIAHLTADACDQHGAVAGGAVAHGVGQRFLDDGPGTPPGR